MNIDYATVHTGIGVPVNMNDMGVPSVAPREFYGFPNVAPCGVFSGGPNLQENFPPPPPSAPDHHAPSFPMAHFPSVGFNVGANHNSLVAAKKHFGIKKESMHLAYFRYRILDSIAKIIVILITAAATLLIFLASVDSWFSESTQQSLTVIGTIVAGVATVFATIISTLKLEARTQAFKSGALYCDSITDAFNLGKYNYMEDSEIADKIDKKNKKLAIACGFPVPVYVLRKAEKKYG